MHIHLIGASSPYSCFCISALLARGNKVTASEIHEDNKWAKHWIDKGVLIPGGHKRENVTKDIDLVVFPNGPIPNNPECEAAKQLGISTTNLPKLVGEVSKQFKVIAIAGTHGKTTTAAIITWMIAQIAGEPNYILGDAKDYVVGLSKNWNFNPASPYLVMEACEYKRQFIDRVPNPYISVITHIDLDHTDYYKSQADYNSAFAEFMKGTTGHVIIDMSKPNEQQAIREANLPLEQITDVQRYRDISIESVLPGEHNRENMLRAYICGITLGLEASEILRALKSFQGISKRFEYAGKTALGNPIYKDYAHNPQKIKMCINGTKEKHPDKRLIIIFQPHSYERTHSFRNEFAKAIKESDLSDNDCLLIPNIFAPVREPEDYKKLINPAEFVDIINSKNPAAKVIYTKDFEHTLSWIRHNEKRGDVIVFASAGDLFDLVSEIVDEKP